MSSLTSKEESPMLRSKKLLAAMSWNTGWLILIALGIVYGTSDSVLLSMIWVSGATQITYIGGQAALDTFVRKAAILAGAGSSSPVQQKGAERPKMNLPQPRQP